jgi:hypothetical protein
MIKQIHWEKIGYIYCVKRAVFLSEILPWFVGVAISASLLSPAVNSGIMEVAWYFTKLEKLEYEVTHNEWRRFAWVSLSLTLVNNIAMIWIRSILMFRLKEVLPIQKKIFWSDLSIPRKIYQGKFHTLIARVFCMNTR